jgi:hypothetical protein
MRCQRVWRGVAWTRSEESKMSVSSEYSLLFPPFPFVLLALYTAPRPPLRPALLIHIISYRCALPSSITPCFTLLISSGDADFLLESPQITVLRRRGPPGAGLPSIVPWRQLPRRARTTLAVNPHVHRHRAPGWIDELPEARLGLVWTDAVVGVELGEYSAPLLALLRRSTLPSISPTVPQPFLFFPRAHRANLLLLANIFLAPRCNRPD